MTNTLILGAHTDGIGDAVYDVLANSENDVFAPSREALDVRDTNSIASYIRSAGVEFDEVVYSVGINQMKWIQDYSGHELLQHFAVNTFGLPLLAAQLMSWQPLHPLSVVAVVSDAAHTPMRGSLAYCASKAAEAMAVRCMARELAPLWRVNGVNPGLVDDTDMTRYTDATTPSFRGWTPEQARSYADSGVPLGRRVRKDEVARLIIDVLRGPEALTGALIDINGAK